MEPLENNDIMSKNKKIASDFDWKRFKEYVNTYDPEKHGLNNPTIIMEDMLYGIGSSMSDDYKFGDGYRKFLNNLKNWIKQKYIK